MANMAKIKDLSFEDIVTICERFNDACECCGLYIDSTGGCYKRLYKELKEIEDREVDLIKLNKDKEELNIKQKLKDVYGED